MKDDKINLMIGLGGVIVGLVGIGYAIGSRKKLNDICDRLNTTIDDISDDLEVTIPNKLVEEAVDKALKFEADRRVKHEVDKVITDIREDIEQKVTKAVCDKYGDITAEVSGQVSSELTKLDMESMRIRIREDAETTVARKFDGQLDDILEKFNTDLDNISKIYTSIARRMSGDGVGKDFKISLV